MLQGRTLTTSEPCPASQPPAVSPGLQVSLRFPWPFKGRTEETAGQPGLIGSVGQAKKSPTREERGQGRREVSHQSNKPVVEWIPISALQDHVVGYIVC